MKKILATLFLVTLSFSACAQSAEVTLAQCLEKSGAIFYGAFWCPECQKQKELFGEGADELPYIECDRDGKDNQFITCQKKNISKYPSWIFADGTRLTGVQSLKTLAVHSNCKLPEAV